jgi:hypothetical protein
VTEITAGGLQEDDVNGAMIDAVNYLGDMIERGELDTMIVITLSKDQEGQAQLEASFVGDTTQVPIMFKNAGALLEEQIRRMNTTKH